MNFIPFSLLASVLVSLILAACTTAPVTGRQQFVLVSEEQTQQMGDQAYQEIMAKSKLSNDPKYVEPVQRVGRDLAQVANRPDYEWVFNVIDDPKTVNAWALPGGKTAIYTGLLNLGVSEDEIAAVMAHEVAHALAQHSRERISQQLGLNLGLSVLGQTGALSETGLQIANAAFGIGVGLPFSRKQESEADLVGLDLMAKAGYDPRAALTLWQKMEQVSGGAKTPEFLSTHPSTGDRMQAIEAALPKYVPVYEANKHQRGR